MFLRSNEVVANATYETFIKEEEDWDMQYQDPTPTRDDEHEAMPVATPFDPALIQHLIQELAHLNLTGERIVRIGRDPVGAGGFADIYMASFQRKQMAVKVIRRRVFEGPHMRVARELHVWSKLTHRHVLKLSGFVLDFTDRQQISLVCPWQPNGCARVFIEGKPLEVVFNVILGACVGLRYLHSKDIVHGDFRGDNILITKRGEAVVSDFGLSKVLTSSPFPPTSSTGNVAWTSPEVSMGTVHTKASDVWACGMTILELMSGKKPYYELPNDGAILIAQRDKVLPQFPVSREFDLQSVSLSCWDFTPKNRPRMSTVPKKLADTWKKCKRDFERYTQTVLSTGGRAQAEDTLGRLADTSRRLFGSESQYTRDIMSHLEFLGRGRRPRVQESEDLLLRTVKAQRRVLGEEHQNTLLSMSQLATLYREQGRKQESEELHLRTSEAQRRVLGEEHQDTLFSMSELATLYRLQGRNQESEELHLRTLEAQRRVLGEEHQDTLISMSQLAILYRWQGRKQESEELRLQTLEAQRRVLSEEHQNTLCSMSELATLYRWQGRKQESEELRLQTLEAQRRVLGEEHHDTIFSMSELAILYREQGRKQESEELLLRAVGAQRRVLSEEHQNTLFSMLELATLYREQGRMLELQPFKIIIN